MRFYSTSRGRKAGKSGFAVLAISLVLFAGCRSAPVIEVCFGDNGMLDCVDERKPEPEQEYSRPLRNDFCTNPDDLEALLRYCARGRQP